MSAPKTTARASVKRIIWRFVERIADCDAASKSSAVRPIVWSRNSWTRAQMPALAAK